MAGSPALMPEGPEEDIVCEDKIAVIEGAYLGDILEQPKALADTLLSLKKTNSLARIAKQLQEGKFRRVVLTGMGSSYHALHPINLELIDHGYTPLMSETSELVHYESRIFDDKTLIIAVSQSGQSAEVIRLLEMNRGRCALLGITNTSGSLLAQQAEAAIVTQAGDEFSVSCKTYVTGLMALTWLGDLLCGRDLPQCEAALAQASTATANYLAHWKENILCLTDALVGVRHLFLVGRGCSLASAGTGALIVKESDHFYAEGMSSAAFRHGPVEMLSQETFVLVFAGDARTSELNHRLQQDIKRQNGRSEVVGANSALHCCRIADHPASIRPILEILPVQMITLALAALEGREPGRFEFASKVTTTE